LPLAPRGEVVAAHRGGEARLLRMLQGDEEVAWVELFVRGVPADHGHRWSLPSDACDVTTRACAEAGSNTVDRMAQRTPWSLSGALRGMFAKKTIDDDTWDDLETALITADFGPDITDAVIEELREQVRRYNTTDPADL